MLFRRFRAGVVFVLSGVYTMASPTHSSHGAYVETAVPTLKVMRLQSPDLGQPSAGSLDSGCILETAMALPDSFGVIHVGETFTAYLGALNVSNELMVRNLTVMAQLQTPSQRLPLPSTLDAGNNAGGVDMSPGDGVDAIVSRALEEAGQHILRVEVSYLTGDGSIKTIRKFYRFNVASPLNIRELTLRAGDAACFVSIAIENVATGPSGGLTISSADFHPPIGLVAERIGGTSATKPANPDKLTAADLFDGCGRLEPGDSFRYMFLVKASTEDATLRGIAYGDELGRAVFTWRKAMGEAGRIASASILCPEAKPPGLLESSNEASKFMMGTGSRFVVHGSGLSVDVAAAAANRAVTKGDEVALDEVLPVTVEPVDPPSYMELAKPQEVQFLIVNHSEKPMTLQLQMRLNHMSGVAVCGPSYRNLGEIPPLGGSSVMDVRLIALVAGLLRVQGCCVVDLSTGQEIPQPPLFNVFVENVAEQ